MEKPYGKLVASGVSGRSVATDVEIESVATACVTDVVAADAESDDWAKAVPKRARMAAAYMATTIEMQMQRCKERLLLFVLKVGWVVFIDSPNCGSD